MSMVFFKVNCFKKWLIPFTIAAFYFSSCHSVPRDPEKNSRAEITGEWKLLTTNDSSILLTSFDRQPQLKFAPADSSFTGYTGCNSISGKMFLNGDKISFTRISTTKRKCINSVDATIVQSLAEVNQVRTEKKELQLLHSGKVLLTFVRKE
jgi:heat shock protein HslJ